MQHEAPAGEVTALSAEKILPQQNSSLKLRFVETCSKIIFLSLLIIFFFGLFLFHFHFLFLLSLCLAVLVDMVQPSARLH